MSQDPRSRRRAETRRRIYEVGMRLFEEQGFDPVSVGVIAATAQVSVPTFYAHFPSKDRIVLQPAELDDIVPLLDPRTAGASITERVEGAIRAWLTAFDGEAEAELLRQWRIVCRTRSLQLRAAEIERAAGAEVIEYLDHARCDETSLAIQLTVFSLFTASTQMLMRWAAAGGRRPLGDVCDDVLRTVRALRERPV